MAIKNYLDSHASLKGLELILKGLNMDNVRELETWLDWSDKLDQIYGKDTTDGKTDKQIEDQVNKDREKIERIKR